MQSRSETFLTLFLAGDADGAAELLAHHPDLGTHCGYEAHPLLRRFVDHNNGHCYKPSHLRIADLLTPSNVRCFREAVVRDEFDVVQNHLRSDTCLIHSEFTAGRGIAQAIHHWKSVMVAELLVDAGGNLEVLTTLGESPLTMQLRFGTVEGVQFLLEKGVNPNHGTGGHMPSHSMGELIELLLAYGWDINNGQMLHDANHGHGKRVETWLTYGANPNLRNRHGQTALHLIAARGTGRDVITMLVESGADINARDDDGNTPLDLARRASTQIAAQQLTKLGADENA
jgi:hypothetical protein